jgi:hypothetical protein
MVWRPALQRSGKLCRKKSEDGKPPCEVQRPLTHNSFRLEVITYASLIHA